MRSIASLPALFGPPSFRGRWDPDRALVLDSRPLESWQGLPLGTGQTGAMVWAAGLCDIQLGRVEAWDGEGNLPALLRLSLEDATESTSGFGAYFIGRLDVAKGRINLVHTCDDGEVELTILAHRSLDAFEILFQDRRREKRPVRVVPVFWRGAVQPLVKDGHALFIEANRSSAFSGINHNGGIELPELADPLAGLQYGSAVAVAGQAPLGSLEPAFLLPPCKEHRIVVVCRCLETGNGEALVRELGQSIRAVLAEDADALSVSDEAFWDDYWSRSYIELERTSRLQPLRAAWYLNRFFAACSMEGRYPPKFNGSCFLYEYDRRYWGGAYWFQNMRLMYWPLLKSGDWDYVRRFIDMYLKAAPAVSARCARIYGHEGLVFPETMHFWGAARRDDAKEGHLVNPYIKNHFEGSLELVWMTLAFHAQAPSLMDAAAVLGIGRGVGTFFMNHFPLRDGKLFLAQSAALETWWEVEQPADQIAGLRAVVPALAALADRESQHDDSAFFRRLQSQLPELPRGLMRFLGSRMEAIDPGRLFVPATVFSHPQKENYEDPELYALWPFGLIGKGLADYGEAMGTFKARLHEEPVYGWSQTAIWAARLGLEEEAAELALAHFSHAARLPGGLFASPGYALGRAGSIPDCGYFDAPGAIATALQEMLLQDSAEGYEVLPAWPKDESVRFRLHARTGPVAYEVN